MHGILSGMIRIKKEDFSNIAVLLYLLLIVCRGMSNVFFYLFAGIAAISFLLSRSSCCLLYLLFLLPFGPMLKSAPGQISFFTVLYILTVAKMVFERKRYRTYSIILILLFAVYGILFSGLSEIITVLTMCCGLIMVYSLRESGGDAEKAILYYSLGLCSASLLALLKDIFPYVTVFIKDSMMKLGKDEYIVRFAGLNGNPNYYTMDITIALSALLVLMNKRRFKGILLVLFVVLSVFGVMSLSKSFILSWILLVAVWFVIAMKQNGKRIVNILLVLILLASSLFFSSSDYINVLIGRFVWKQGSTMNDFTTGRFEVWILYLQEFFGDLKVLMFGNGLNNRLYKGAHNTYIESIFYLGVIGSTIWWSAIKNCMGKVISNPIMWVPVSSLLIRMWAIGITTYDNLCFYLALIVMLSKYGDRIGDLAHEH